MKITLEELLSNLPTVILMWTTFTLCWGVYINIAFYQMVAFTRRHKTENRVLDACNGKFIFLANIILTGYLLFEPHLTTMGDAIVVIDVFYTAYLFAASISLARWWKVRQEYDVDIISHNDHILT